MKFQVTFTLSLKNLSKIGEILEETEKAGIFVNSFMKHNMKKLRQKKLLTINYLRTI